ncbi:hypothetical protein SARC_08974 [Sphaeroforma arctica JP610]|uniref:Uncharacterized protein n=1 Tax=Sphaeroforma arctica JP610 TaxID=667725 RepID=A0A0L0FPH2_9EUKA|nr:hypothetical protein SARC_08974 [Sphaeroforma arctica JP610]KNC78604.1 hypothetical protein SARC_08974 [Sphaeroforma arctica JP610]|eukprot:XP_014152506.1 hypothetical protein SARC_08974 [Sphaeroforma arctica JP610]
MHNDSQAHMGQSQSHRLTVHNLWELWPLGGGDWGLADWGLGMYYVGPITSMSLDLDRVGLLEFGLS